MARIPGLLLYLLWLNPWRCASQLHIIEKTDSLMKGTAMQGLPQNFYSQHLGFFCRKEIQLQKTLSIPLFIRLGSKSYVDYLEKKGSSILKANGSF